jgi:hypothetical protein
VVVLPLATGMTMTLVLLAAAASRGSSAKYVVWSRIDQKTCLKAITAANLQVWGVSTSAEGIVCRRSPVCVLCICCHPNHVKCMWAVMGSLLVMHCVVSHQAGDHTAVQVPLS